MIRSYSSLDVWVIETPERDVYRVHAKHLELGEGTATFKASFSQEDLDDLRHAISGEPRRDVRVSPSRETRALAKNFGRELFGSVFTGEVHKLFLVAVSRTTPEAGVQIRLHLSGEPATWPWELLHDSTDFLALSVKTPIVRYLEKPGAIQPLRISLPLRALVVTSSPRGYDPIDTGKEWRKIREALELLPKGQVEVELADNPTLSTLRKLMKKRFHVLHFIGHGKFDRQEQTGWILLQDEQGRASPVTGDALIRILKNRDSVRLVVLNACEGACCSSDDISSGIAQGLVLAGLPAVIAMQSTIEDRSAILFAQDLYESLAQGEPVDSALAEARNAMDSGAQGEALDWASPVLFLRSPDGRLFEIAPDKPPWWRWLVLMFRGLLLGLAVWAAWFFVSVDSPVQCTAASKGLPDLKLMLVHGETFRMGSSGGEKDERPEHRVKISQDFCLSAYEVNQKQWTEIMGANSVRSEIIDDALPVTKVSYQDVQEFLRKLNEKEGQEVFRLPWEAEWELAAQSPGGGWNCAGGSREDQFDRLAEVGSLQPNRLGLYDMLGNAWEWVGDWYAPYKEGKAVDPEGPSSGEVRVRKGGAFDSASKNCRPTRRATLKPGSRFQNTGFRLLRELPR